MSLVGMLCTNTHPQSSISFVSYARDVSYQYSHGVVVYHVPKLDVIVWLGTFMGPDMWWCRHIIIWLFKHIMALISYCKNDSRTDVKAIGTSLDLETWNMAMRDRLEYEDVLHWSMSRAFPILRLAYKSLSYQRDVWQYLLKDGMCYSMAQRLVLHLL